MIHIMPELFELYEIERFLPLPYEAALGPRLKRAQDRLQRGGPCLDWVRLPEEGAAVLRLHALAESVRAQGRTLLAVEDGGLREGVRGVAGCLGGETERICFLSGLPSPEELRRALELAAHGEVLLCAAGGGEGLAFRILRRALEERYGAQAERYILHGGDPRARHSGGFALLSAQGLLLLAACGVDVGALLAGASEIRQRCAAASFENPAWRYAAVRRQLGRAGFTVELLCGWDPRLHPLLEWAKGLGGGALLSAAVDCSREIRSLDRCVLEGPRCFFETVVRLEPEAGDPLPRHLREAAVEGALRGHTAAGVPNLILRPGGREARALGKLLYFFQYAGALSALMGDKDPFACPAEEDGEPSGLWAGSRDWSREVPAEPAAASPSWYAGAGIV